MTYAQQHAALSQDGRRPAAVSGGTAEGFVEGRVWIKGAITGDVWASVRFHWA